MVAGELVLLEDSMLLGDDGIGRHFCHIHFLKTRKKREKEREGRERGEAEKKGNITLPNYNVWTSVAKYRETFIWLRKHSESSHRHKDLQQEAELTELTAMALVMVMVVMMVMVAGNPLSAYHAGHWSKHFTCINSLNLHNNLIWEALLLPFYQ
jgi:hypothetical protein